MILGGEHEALNITLNNTNIEQITEFQNLGTRIEEKGTQEFINKREISIETKIKVFKAIYRPVLTYGCEPRVLTERQKNIRKPW